MRVPLSNNALPRSAFNYTSIARRLHALPWCRSSQIKSWSSRNYGGQRQTILTGQSLQFTRLSIVSTHIVVVVVGDYPQELVIVLKIKMCGCLLAMGLFSFLAYHSATSTQSISCPSKPPPAVGELYSRTIMGVQLANRSIMKFVQEEVG